MRTLLFLCDSKCSLAENLGGGIGVLGAVRSAAYLLRQIVFALLLELMVHVNVSTVKQHYLFNIFYTHVMQCVLEC